MQTLTLKTNIIFLLLSGMLLALPALAADYKPNQFTLTVDAVGQEFFHPNNPAGSYSSYTGVGGQIFADYRPFQEVSFGLGADYVSYSSPSFNIQSFDLGGRIYPAGYSSLGEFYLQGGMGLNILPFGFAPLGGIWGHYHGNAGLGYRMALVEGIAFDMGAQYDYYSPYLTPSHGVRIKAGLTFGFGPEPAKTLLVGAATGAPAYTPNWKLNPHVTWGENDTLGALAEKMYGDADLYPLIVDANATQFRSGKPFEPGMTLVIPAPPADVRALDAIRNHAIQEREYVHLENLSEASSNGWGEGWTGPTHYTWKKGDDLPSVADELYGDEDLYPLLVDANMDRLVLPVNLQPGVVLVVPKPKVDEIDEIHMDVWFDKDPYIWWKNVSVRTGAKYHKNESSESDTDNSMDLQSGQADQ